MTLSLSEVGRGCIIGPHVHLQEFVTLPRRRRAVMQQEGVRTHAGAAGAHGHQLSGRGAGKPPLPAGEVRIRVALSSRLAGLLRAAVLSVQGGQQAVAHLCAAPGGLVHPDSCGVDSCRLRSVQHHAGVGRALWLGVALRELPACGPRAFHTACQCFSPPLPMPSLTCFSSGFLSGAASLQLCIMLVCLLCLWWLTAMPIILHVSTAVLSSGVFSLRVRACAHAEGGDVWGCPGVFETRRGLGSRLAFAVGAIRRHWSGLAYGRHMAARCEVTRLSCGM